MKSSHIPAFYDPRMSLDQEKWQGYTQTPAKPKLMMEYLERKNLMEYFRIKDDWPPYDREDFYIAHTREMVDNFFDRGKHPGFSICSGHLSMLNLSDMRTQACTMQSDMQSSIRMRFVSALHRHSITPIQPVGHCSVHFQVRLNQGADFNLYAAILQWIVFYNNRL